MNANCLSGSQLFHWSGRDTGEQKKEQTREHRNERRSAGGEHIKRRKGTEERRVEPRKRAKSGGKGSKCKPSDKGGKRARGHSRQRDGGPPAARSLAPSSSFHPPYPPTPLHRSGECAHHDTMFKTRNDIICFTHLIRCQKVRCPLTVCHNLLCRDAV